MPQLAEDDDSWLDQQGELLDEQLAARQAEADATAAGVGPGLSRRPGGFSESVTGAGREVGRQWLAGGGRQ